MTKNPDSGLISSSQRTSGDAAGSFARAQILLQAIARAGSDGAGLRDLVAATGLPRPTIHRVLAMLETAGWIERDTVSRHFFLGPELLALGVSAAARHPLSRVAATPLARLAADIAQPVYLVVRSGNDSVCVARDESGRRIQTLVLQVGSREPLGIGAGSMALLAALPEPDMAAFVDANRTRYEQRHGFDAASFLTELANARTRGFAAHDSLFTPGVSGIGVAVTDATGYPLAGISTAFVGDWLPPEERARIVTRIAEAAREITANLLRTSTALSLTTAKLPPLPRQ